MKIVLTGTGSPLPDADRAGPSTLVEAGDAQVLVDCGRGTVMRLAAAGTLPPLLAGVCITHLHSDHICALNDLITTHWVMSQGASTLRVWGPVGTSQLVDRTLAMLEADIGYRIAHHDVLTQGPQVEVTEVDAGDSFAVGDITVATAATDHAPVRPTIGYRFSHGDVAVALVGDTLPCDGVDELCLDAQAYVQTVIRRDLVEQIPHPMVQDILDYHSGVVEAAQTAARCRVGTLVLTHLVPAPTPEQHGEWRSIAAEHFDGEVVVGRDLTEVVV